MGMKRGGEDEDEEGRETKRKVVELEPGRDFGPWESGEGDACTDTPKGTS